MQPGFLFTVVVSCLFGVMALFLFVIGLRGIVSTIPLACVLAAGPATADLHKNCAGSKGRHSEKTAVAVTCFPEAGIRNRSRPLPGGNMAVQPGFRLARFGSLVALAASLSIPVISFAADEAQPSARAQEIYAEANRLERQRDELAARERQAADALNGAEQALALARKLNDRESIPLAEQAVAIARSTLSDARARRDTVQRQLDDRLRLLGRSDAPDARAVGRVGNIMGPVFIHTKVGLLPVGRDFVLREGDRIETGDTGRAVFAFDDGNYKVVLNEKSAFTLAERKERASTLDFAVGMIRLVAKCARSTLPCQHRVRTSTAVAAVRGTDYEVVQSAGSTTLRVFEGIVETTPLKVTKPIQVHAGQMVIIDAGGRVTGPRAMTPAESRPFVAEVGTAQ